MTSPINNTINRPTADSVSSSASKTREKSSAEPSTAPAPVTEDTVSLSAESLQAGELQQQLNSIPEVNAEKVEAIRQEIAKGNYPLDPERIAENLINLEKALTE